MYNTPKSDKLIEYSKNFISSGANTLVFDLHKENPFFFFVESAKGSKIFDIDDNQYIDFLCGYGSLIFGHTYNLINLAIEKQLAKGLLFCFPTEAEVQLSKMLVDSSVFIDQVRFMSTGTEAVMSAVRLAKYYTNRSLIIKFDGSYHGHADSVLGKFYPQAQRGQYGIDPFLYDNTLLARYNNIEDVENYFLKYNNQIAVVIIEPIACNRNLTLPTTEFLANLRKLCDQHGALLIFDEVITGFRFNYGSIVNKLKVEPDLVTFGKVLGGGTPIGVYGGKKHIMALHNSENDGLHFAGTFSANPLTISASIATLQELQKGHFYQHGEELGSLLEINLIKELKEYADSFEFKRLGSVFVFKPLKNKQIYSELYNDYSKLNTAMLREGFIMTPSPDETMYISYSHTEEDILSFSNTLAKIFIKEIIK
jgi:glutamate-1-semialdehyde 2,1-aminomutase